jgi:hypothetical protein
VTSTPLQSDMSFKTLPRRRLRRDPASSATAIVGLVTVAAIHWAQVVPTMSDAPFLATGFLLVTLSSVGLAFCLFVSDMAVAWLGVAVLNALTVAGYIFTRSVSSFFDRQDVGNWSETLGMVALLVESLLILFSLYRVLEDRLPMSRNANQRSLVPAVDLRVDVGNTREPERSLPYPFSMGPEP